MDRIEAMTTLVAVVEAGNLSAAARQMNTPLATVSRRIADLEDYLKIKLLNRSTRQVTLTDAGQSFLPACRRILDELQEAERMASGEYAEPKGELFVTATPIFGRAHLLPIVAEFLKTYPEINVRLLLSDQRLNLFEEHIDVALRIGESTESSLIAIPVGSVTRVICASPGYFERTGMPTNLADLIGRDAITYEGPTAALDWHFPSQKGFDSYGVKSRIITNTPLAALDAALDGMGVVRLPSDLAKSYIESGRLIRVLREHEPTPMPAYLIHTSGRRVPRKLRAFLDFAAPRLRARLRERRPASQEPDEVLV
ncbi:MAG TPA: LysR family transcriptional regulator [Stellaceae bacterium]|jgi:DNA-binding transcriptional LysR family regulator|nr:LysR family transcriptional regulator [Stellaceae bacterium]